MSAPHAAGAAAPHAQTLRALRAELEQELTRRILPWWMERAVDERRGGFVGLIAPDERGREVAHHDAPKGAILNTRILWTFSAAHRVLGEPAYRAAADRAASWVAAHLVDPVHGGVYWMVDAAGRPADERKHVYAQAFAIYALSEYARATGDGEALRRAVDLFRLVERHAHDPAHGGYQEAFSRDWVLLDDVRLSDEDADERKSMNTHLHLLEAYANLYRVWPDALLRGRLEALVELFLGTIVPDGSGHVVAFFDEDWTPKSAEISYGHDIETSWLLLEAADVLGEGALRDRVRTVSLRMAAEVLATGFDAEAGGLFNQGGPGGVRDTDKEWWPQAEAIVGFVSAYQESERDELLRAALATWAFVRRHVLDLEQGEWRRRVARDGTPRPGREKLGPWKCPYHNARTCLEVITRVDAMAGESAS